MVEGAELLAVAFEAGAQIESVYVAPEGRTNPAVAAVVDRVFDSGVRVFDLAPGVIERIADTVTPQPVVAVVGFVPAELSAIMGATTVMVLSDVRDPGNVGTMIRTADATGVGAVICCAGSVDPTNPKSVRASAGSLFHVPLVVGSEAEDVIRALRTGGFTTVGTVVRNGTEYTAFDWNRPIALVFGNEASGLAASLSDTVDHQVSIPMVGRAESLNVSISAAVLCFEVLRRRRAADGNGRPTVRRSDSSTPNAGGGPSTISGMDTVPAASPGQGTIPAAPRGVGADPAAPPGRGADPAAPPGRPVAEAEGGPG